MNLLIIFIRILITFICALLFGFDRQKTHKPVGFGTFIFVSLGACALGLTADSLGLPGAIALLGATVTGIGFLGAGALVKGTDKVFGFTTASSIWLLAIFGLLIGTGELLIGIIIYVFVWVVVFIDKRLEDQGVGSYQKKLTVTTNKLIHEKDLRKYFIITKKHKTMSFEIDKKNNRIVLCYLVEGTKDNLNTLLNNLYKEPWIESCKVE